MVNLEQFKEYLCKRNLKRVSIDSYLRDIEQFFDYLGQAGVTDIRRITGEDVSRYCEYMTGRGLAPVSIQRKLASIKRLFDHLCTSGQVRGNPAAGIHVRKRSAARAKALTDEQLMKLLNMPDPLQHGWAARQSDVRINLFDWHQGFGAHCVACRRYQP